MRIAWITTFSAALALMACAVRQPEPVQMQMRFDYDLHKPYTQLGTNTIKGQGFLRQKGGGLVTCAGNYVLLLPATPFFREALSHLRAGRNPLFADRIDPAYRTMIKQSQCDAQGNFTFSGLPNGGWLVVTEVKWTVGYSPQGGALMQEVNIANGETKQVLLTDKDFIGW